MGDILELFSYNDIFMRIALCVLLIMTAVCVHFISKKWLTKKFERHTAKGLLYSKKINTLLTFLLSTIRYIVYFFIFYLFCKALKLPIDSIFLAVAGAGSVAIGLGAQTLMKNIINGFFILLEDQYSVGDVILIDQYKGTVEEIGIRTTIIKDIDGNRYIIPNGEINVVTNMTQKIFPSFIDINLPYEANAENTIAILNEEMAGCEGKIDGLLSTPTVLGISSLGQYCYTVKIKVESEQSKYLGVERGVRFIVKKRFDSEGIPMPAFPPLATGS